MFILSFLPYVIIILSSLYCAVFGPVEYTLLGQKVILYGLDAFLFIFYRIFIFIFCFFTNITCDSNLSNYLFDYEESKKSKGENE